MNVRTRILFFNKFFDETPDVSALTAEEQRAFTMDARLFEEADAVVFHIPSLPYIQGLKKRPGQLWVLWSMESSVNYPCMTDPSFLRFFDLTMTYERKADIWTPYLPAFPNGRQPCASRCRRRLSRLR